MRNIIEPFVRAISYFMPSASLMALALFAYAYIPFYGNFLSYLATYIIFGGGALYIAGGFVYSVWFAFRDPTKLEKRLAGDYFWQWLVELPSRLRARMPLFGSEEAKRTVLGIFVKAFFFPLMLQFFVSNVRRAILMAQSIGGVSWELLPSASKGFAFWFSVLLIVDTWIFMFAYIVEHGRLGNRLRSVDATFGGWFVALICYPPFNFYTLRRMDKYAAAAIGGPGAPLISGLQLPDSAVVTVSRLVAFLLFVIYVGASVALGWRAGNLVNRGIVERGVYGFVRHPAYVAKNLGWWFESLPQITLAGALALIALNAVYVLRALTEERHLLKDPDYRAYCRKVRWRFIPRVV